MQYQELLTEVFLNNGITAELNEQLDLDSLQFISLIVEIEETFGINFPDDYLVGTALNTINDYLYFVTDIKKKILQGGIMYENSSNW